jgi:hypothetical protein
LAPQLLRRRGFDQISLHDQAIAALQHLSRQEQAGLHLLAQRLNRDVRVLVSEHRAARYHA